MPENKPSPLKEEAIRANGEFQKIAESKKYKVRYPSKKVSAELYVSLYLKGQDASTKLDREVAVDVKAFKKPKGRNNGWVWIEVKNVRGQDGWINGESNFVAFEREKDFILIPRTQVLHLVNSKVRFDLGLVNSAHQAKYRVYQRKGRRDQIAQVKISDLLKLNNVSIWKKL